jgi:Caspase domain
LQGLLTSPVQALTFSQKLDRVEVFLPIICAYNKHGCEEREMTLTGLKNFTDHCEPSDLLIVHFSGHGIYDEQLYLVCNGTDITNLDASAIGVDSIKRVLRKCKARHKLLVLDCCYAGGASFGAFKGVQDIEGMLSKELEGSASMILSACSRFELRANLCLQRIMLLQKRLPREVCHFI